VRIQFLSKIILLPGLLISAALACSDGSKSADGKTKLTIYTSIYESVIVEIEPVLAKQFPDIEIEWYQKGSEEVAAKLNSEILAGNVNADLVMTSDPFWYEELKNAGYLMNYDSPAAAALPPEFRDPDHAFDIVRMPVMVLCANTDKLTADARPKSFKELADPKWKGRITMGDPLSSGSTFTTVAALAKKYGWDYFKSLRANEIVAAGGNSSVLNRITTGEKEVGIILLENLLKAKQENPALPVEIIYPEDGAVLIPSPIAILKTTKSGDAAKKLYEFMLGPEGQEAIVHGWMYSPLDSVVSPEGAKPWSEIRDSALVPWSDAYLKETYAARETIKQEFSRIISE